MLTIIGWCPCSYIVPYKFAKCFTPFRTIHTITTKESPFFKKFPFIIQ